MAVADSVHAHLRTAILSGELSPGDAIPSERELSERFGVNRHGVRDAIKRLQQARLVQVTHGGPTRVLDWRANAGLDVILDLGNESTLDLAGELLLSVGELRASVGTDAARRCAARAPQELRAAAAHLAERLAGTGEREERMAANEALWQLLIDGSGNLAYRLALNTLVLGLHLRPELDELFAAGPDDADELHALARALEAGDAEGAAAAARPVLERPLAGLE